MVSLYSAAALRVALRRRPALSVRELSPSVFLCKQSASVGASPRIISQVTWKVRVRAAKYVVVRYEFYHIIFKQL